MTIARQIAPLLMAAAIAAMPLSVQAQNGQTAPNAFQGFNQNRDKPIQIKAQSFEVRDKDHKATFSGNVHVVQGEATIRCRTLIVTYESDSSVTGVQPAPRSAQQGAPGKSQISKLEALGGVIVTQKDQTATGDSGYFDIRTNTVTLVGNVVVSQGGNVMRGERLVVDLTSGVSRVESGKSRGQVEMLVPQSQPNGAKPAVPAPAQSPKIDLLRPGQPY